MSRRIYVFRLRCIISGARRLQAYGENNFQCKIWNEKQLGGLIWLYDDVELYLEARDKNHQTVKKSFPLCYIQLQSQLFDSILQGHECMRKDIF